LLDPAIFQARREELRTMIRADLDRTVASRRTEGLPSKLTFAGSRVT
jgi:hypothetical protein